MNYYVFRYQIQNSVSKFVPILEKEPFVDLFSQIRKCQKFCRDKLCHIIQKSGKSVKVVSCKN